VVITKSPEYVTTNLGINELRVWLSRSSRVNCYIFTVLFKIKWLICTM